MRIDVNFNNNQKHWILILLDKCRNIYIYCLNNIIRFIRRIKFLIQKNCKCIVYITSLILIIISVFWGYNYYQNEYLPKKNLDIVTTDILSNLFSKNDSIRTEYSYNILFKFHNWNYANIDNEIITNNLSPYRKDAFDFIEKKAYEGDAKNQFNLGCFYHLGEKVFYNVLTNKEKAAYWYNEAAKQNYYLAFSSLGQMYMEGEGVPINFEKAVFYFKKGAEAGDLVSQLYYGDLFVEGIKIHNKKTQKTSILVPKDIEQAKYWWNRVSIKNYELVKDRLEKIYE